MFNTKLEKQVKELKRELEYQKRFNDEMYNLTKRMCKRLGNEQSEQLVCGTCKNKRVELYWHETGMGVKPCEDCKAN